MPAPFFTTNPSEFTRLEGLYIFEQNPPGFVRGVSLSTVGVYGTTVKGPVDTPVRITSEQRFNEVFGDLRQVGGGAIASEVKKSLLNKPFGALEVVRVAAAAATAASFNEEDTDGGGGVEIIKIEASSVGSWGGDVGFRVEGASDGDVLKFDLVIRYNGVTVRYENLNTQAGNDNLLEVIGDDLSNFVTVTKLADGRPLSTDAHTGAYLAALDTGAVGGFMLLGTVVASFTSVAGTDGTVAATDYTGSGRALDKISGKKGVAIVYCANEDGTITAAVNAATLIKITVDNINDRIYCIHEGELTGSAVDVSAVATDAASFRSDRIIYCHNAPSTLDPDTGTKIQTAPNAWMASILSQTDVDIHPGEEDTKRFTVGMLELDDETLTREDYITLKEAGIASLERDAEGGFLFVSGVVTDLTPGKTEITRRRSADFIQLSLADRLKFFVKKKNFEEIRGLIGSEATAFLRILQNQRRVVELFEIDQVSQNSPTTRGQGLEFVLIRVRLIGHILFLVLKTEIGTGVTIETEAA